MRRLLVLFAVLLATALGPASQAQAQTVSGTVADSTGLPLPGATVLLSNRSDRVLAAFTTADTSGAFRLPAVAPGAYDIRVSFLGFEPLTRPVDVSAGPVDVGRLTLRPRESELGQLEVVGGRDPVVVRGDTLVYDAAAYDVRAGATVEGLLGEMPGIEVDDDGTVRAQGRVVDRVTVDGRDFFGSAPSVATRNLPADAVDRVEVFDERPDGAAGESGRRTINLALREDRRQGAFGRVEGGGGADVADPASVRYAGRASVNRFGPSTRLSAIGSANNVNEPGLTGREYLGLVGTGDAGPGELIRIESAIPLDGDAVQGYASSWTGGANVNIDAAPGTSVQANYVGYAARTVTARETVRERPAAGAGTVVETETADGAATDWVHRAEARADRAFGDDHDLRVITTLDAQGGDGDSDVSRRVVDGPPGASSYRTASRRLNARLDARYRRGLGARWQLRAEAEAALGRRDDDARADSSCAVCADGPLPDPGVAGTPVRGTSQTAAVRTVGIRSLGGRRSVQFRAEQTLDVQSQALADDSPGVAGPETYRRTHTATALGASYTGGAQALRFSAGADLAYAQRHAPQTVGAFRVLPSASFDYTLAQNRTVGLRYSVRSAPTPAFTLHAVPTLLRPFQVHVGNPDVRDETAHTATAQYFDVDAVGGSTLFLAGVARYRHDAQSFARTVDAGGVTTAVPVNAGDAWNAGGSALYERSLREQGIAVRVSASGGVARAREVVNGQPSTYQVTDASADVRVRRREGAFRQSQVGLRASVQAISYESGVGLSRTETRLNPYVRLSVVRGGVSLRVTAEQEVRIGTLAYPTRAPLVGVDVALPPMRRVSVSIAASDLLNGGVGIEQVVAPGFAEVSRYETLGRRLVLRLTTTF